MRFAELFAGIGGFGLAADWMGWEHVFFCEYEQHLLDFLKTKWPGAKSIGDIRHADFNEFFGKIDVLTGGFPCQPVSDAGLRKGEADSRWLWPEMLRAIGEIRPTWIVGENVAGILTHNRGETFRRATDALVALGYEVECYDIPAYSVGLQTLERHIWIVAKADGQRCQRGKAPPHPYLQNEREFPGANQGVPDRWDISKTKFRHVAERVSRSMAGDKWKIKAGGNAIPPPVALEIFQAIQHVENESSTIQH